MVPLSCWFIFVISPCVSLETLYFINSEPNFKFALYNNHMKRSNRNEVGASVFDGNNPQVSLSYEPPEWQAYAACAEIGKEVFFSGGGTKDRIEAQAQAKALCAECSVRQPCLEYGIKYDPQEGIWGGLTLKERQRVNRRNGAKRSTK